jgi:hypothetical protein
MRISALLPWMTIYTEHARIRGSSYSPARGIFKYALVDGGKTYQVVIYFRARGALSGGIRGCRRLHPTMVEAEKYRARLRTKLGDCTI